MEDRPVICKGQDTKRRRDVIEAGDVPPFVSFEEHLAHQKQIAGVCDAPRCCTRTQVDDLRTFLTRALD